jgi:N4-gp56 family major capsid protein
MKEFYDTALLENAREASVFDQFAKVQPMTHGKTAEWRKFKTFAPATTPLQEGVVPTGKTLGMTNITATLSQHGDFVPVSDVLEMTAFDDVIFGATEEMGAAGGETDDILTRNALLGENATNVMWVNGGSSRDSLSGSDKLTPADINKAVTMLKKMKAPKINGYYVAVIHPSVAEDIRESTEWKEFHKYNAVNPIFKGEIGELHGCKFIESNNAKIWENAKGAVYGTLVFGKDAFGKLSLDGGDKYGKMTSKVSLTTLDFYRSNRKIFDKHKLDKYYWLATPDSNDNSLVLCVAPSGYVRYGNIYGDSIGVRPFCILKSNIFVSK